MFKNKTKIKKNFEVPEFDTGFFWLKNKYLRYLVLSLVAGTVAVSAIFYGGQETPSPDFGIQTVKIEEKYPRVANLFFKWDISDAEAKELAKWDVVVIDMEAQVNTPDGLKKIKAYNPQIKILAYITSQEFTHHFSNLKSSSMRRRLYGGLSDDWWLNSSGGGRLVWWPGTWLLNVTEDCPQKDGKRWNDYLPEFVAREILNSDFWDGVFYDNAWESVSWLPSGDEVDLNSDGQAESARDIDQKWREGMNKIFRRTKELAPGKIVMGNGGKGYFNYLNGIAIEHFHKADWVGAMNDYFFILGKSQSPAVTILNSNTDNTGRQDDYAKMRFGLLSTLLGDGYYSFDYGDQAHNQLWWYDEYGTFLGKPLNSAYNIGNGSTKVAQGVWRRDFKNGVVLLNSTSTTQAVTLDEEFEKVRGLQDKTTNDGSIVQSVKLPARDGLILLRRTEVTTVSNFQNGSYMRIFDGAGKAKRTGFFTYEEKYKPGSAVLTSDLDQDGSAETVVADSSKIEIWSKQGNKIASFYPYGEKYDKGINFVTGDVNHDGKLEIVTGTERGGGPQVRIFNWQGKLIHPGFFAYGKSFRGGVSVALGDLDGNGWLEIITGAGFGGGPHIRIFSGGGKLMNPGFFAFDQKFRGGVNVAAADLNDDGKAEIIAGAGVGGSPTVKVWQGEDLVLKAEFLAFDARGRGGVKVATEDIDQDGKAEVLASTTDIFSLTNK